jgi:cytidylate kinase
MNTRAISITRQVGVAGEEVAAEVASRLGWRVVDYQVIQRAAEEAGVSVETVTEAEHAPSLVTRILEALARNPSVPVAAWADPLPLATSPLATSTDYRQMIEGVLRETAERGNCVIVGHTSGAILMDRLDTFRVLITGTIGARLRRLKVTMSVDDDAALKTIKKSDNERVDYFHRFYEVGFLDPSTYDLCINTDHLNPEQTAELIVQAAQLR